MMNHLLLCYLVFVSGSVSSFAFQNCNPVTQYLWQRQFHPSTKTWRLPQQRSISLQSPRSHRKSKWLIRHYVVSTEVASELFLPLSPLVTHTMPADSGDYDTLTLAMKLSLASVAGFGSLPLVNMYHNVTNVDSLQGKQSLLYGVVDSLSKAGLIYLVLSFVELAILPFFLPQSIITGDADTLSTTADQFRQVGITLWLGWTSQRFKRMLLAQQTSSKNPDKLGRISLYDSLADWIIAAVTLMFVLELLHVDLGPGIMSVFTAGGLGALLFSFATKGLAEQIVGGLIVKTWDVFKVGDSIRILTGDSPTNFLEGQVVRIGLVETDLKGGDDVVTKIPNSQIINKKISNLSNTHTFQVKQILRFHYEDLDKLPVLLKDIQSEIIASCPTVIQDGSHPFRVYLHTYNPDHMEVIANCHFPIPLTNTSQCIETRQTLLLAIAKAMKQHSVDFAIPSIVQYKSSTGADDMIQTNGDDS